jgi:hypothetical protein
MLADALYSILGALDCHVAWLDRVGRRKGLESSTGVIFACWGKKWLTSGWGGVIMLAVKVQFFALGLRLD